MLQPATQAPDSRQRLPAAQLNEEHGLVQVPVAESHVPPCPQGPLPVHASLQRPSPGSHVCSPGHATVVQSGTAAMHWEDPVSQVLPPGQSAFVVQPGSQDSVRGEQNWPTTQPVMEQSAGAASQALPTHTEPKPQSEAWLQPGMHFPPPQCEP